MESEYPIRVAPDVWRSIEEAEGDPSMALIVYLIGALFLALAVLLVVAAI